MQGFSRLSLKKQNLHEKEFTNCPLLGYLYQPLLCGFLSFLFLWICVLVGISLQYALTKQDENLRIHIRVKKVRSISDVIHSRHALAYNKLQHVRVSGVTIPYPCPCKVRNLIQMDTSPPNRLSSTPHTPSTSPDQWKANTQLLADGRTLIWRDLNKHLAAFTSEHRCTNHIQA